MFRTIQLYLEGFKRKANTILLFTYGIVVGTSTPLLLSRCTTGGADCSSCGGFCSLAIGILPLILYITLRGRAKRTGQYMLSLVHKKTE